MVKLDETSNEKYFPRGGGTEKPKKAESDAPAGKQGLKRKSAAPEQNEAKKVKEETSWIPKVEENCFIEGLTGLGVVAEVFDDGVLLHTAGTHTVKIHASEVSKKFTELFNEEKIEMKDAFQLGQMVPFRVISKKNDKGKAKASCNPARLNKHLSPNMLAAGLVIHTSVVSLEEKGAILDVGLDQITGFIEKAQFPASGLKEGCPLIVRILSSTSRVVKVTSFVEQDNLNMASCEKLQLNHLMPGTILECEPTGDAVTAGVIVGIGNGLKGILPRRNLPPRLRENPEKLGKAIRAVVMFCQQNSKILVLNAHPDIVAVSRIEKRTSFEGISIGDKVTCTVIDTIATKSIVYFTLPPTDGKKSLVTAISSRGLLENPDAVATKYEVGTEKLCRVTGYRYADRTITVSTRKDILNQKITTYKDAKCGDILDARVHHIAKSGVYFMVCNFVKAFAPMSLLSDKPLTSQKIKALFRMGTEVKCRVWQICEQRKNLIVTCREQILGLKGGATANSVEELEVGNTVPCVIRKVFPTGVVLLATYNNISGVLRRESAPPNPKVNDFVIANVEKIEENGRVVFVLKDQKPSLQAQNLGAGASEKKLIQKPKSADSGIAIGKIYTGSLSCKKGEKASVTFTGEAKKEVYASVDDHLLSDLLDAPIGLTKRILMENKEEKIQIVPMGKLAAVNRACVKRSIPKLLKSMKAVKKIEELTIGRVVVGVVSQIHTNIGVFVEICGGSGLVGKVFERKSAKNVSELFEVGQVFVGKVESVDVAKKSFLIDPCTEMENSEHMLKQYALPLLESIVEEVKWLAEHSNYPAPGTKVDAKITKELEDLTLVEFEHNGKKIAGVVPKKPESGEKTPKKKKKSSSTTKLIIVDINHATNEVILAPPTSENPRIMAIRRDYLCAVSSEGLIYLPTRLHPNHLPPQDSKLKIHTVIDLSHQKSISDGVFIAVRGGGDVDDVARTAQIKKEFLGSVKKEAGLAPAPGEGGKKSIKNFGIYNGVVLGAAQTSAKRTALFVDIRLPGDNIGRLHISEFPPGLLNAENPLQEFLDRNVNKSVVVRIIGFLKAGKGGAKIAELTMIPTKIQAGKIRGSQLSYKSNYSVGDLIKCFGAAKLTDNQEIKVEVNPLWIGTISREHLSKDLKKSAGDGGIVDFALEKGEMRQAKVISVDRKSMHVSLSLETSEQENSEFKLGATVTGRVFFVSKTYIRLKLASGQQAVLTPTAITEKYEQVGELMEKQLPMGKLVDVVCAKVQEKPRRYFVVLEPRYTGNCSNDKRKLLLDAASLKEGTQFDGIVENASKGSLFVEIGPGIQARVPVNEENQEILEIGTGSVVRVTIAKVTKTETLLKLDDILIRKWTVKPDRKRNASKSEDVPSKVALLEEEKTSDAAVEESEDPGFDWSNKGFRNEDLAAVGKLTSVQEEEDSEDEDEEEEEDSDEEEVEEEEGAEESEDVDDEEDVEDDEAEDEEESDEDEENKVELLEKSEEEHSRMVRSDPNSAINWIQYMSLFVEKSDLAAARKTAEEGLKAIDQTESEELIKLWTAYLNMEVAYGESATVQEVFKRACQNVNSYTIHKTLAKIYQNSQKNQEATRILEEMIKKFRANKLEVWTLLAEHLMTQKDQKAARDLLPRALKSAPKAAQHIQLISKFAQLEFKHGDAERGRTLLEGLVTAHPKKMDLWLVYADAALKYLGVEHARKILERACNLDLTTHKMRPLYKKWLEMESKHGDPASVQLVKLRAEKFLQSVADHVMEQDDEDN